MHTEVWQHVSKLWLALVLKSYACRNQPRQAGPMRSLVQDGPHLKNSSTCCDSIMAARQARAKVGLSHECSHSTLAFFLASHGKKDAGGPCLTSPLQGRSLQEEYLQTWHQHPWMICRLNLICGRVGWLAQQLDC